MPAPRIVVLEDMDKPPGRGAFIGDVHAAILRALGCIGVVTDGAVRELPRVREMEFHLFAGNVAVSHAYAHIFHFGAAVTVGGLEVHPGDLLHGDGHGVLSIPRQIAGQVPAVANRLREKEKQLIAACRKGELPLEKLREIFQDIGIEIGGERRGKHMRKHPTRNYAIIHSFLANTENARARERS